MKSSPVVTVSFIGAGHVAHHLARNFHKKGVVIKQIFNRSVRSGTKLSKNVDAHYINSLADLEPSDVLIIAINDNAISTVSAAIPKEVSSKTIIVHTSGSQSMDLLGSHRSYGSFYPLQSFRKELEIDMSLVPILISSPDKKVIKELKQLGSLLSNRVTLISDKDRSLLHLPAVMVNNFTNHLLQLAYDYCESKQLDFSLLLPLVNETVKRLDNNQPPRAMQTGPAIRRDMATIENHENQLEAHPNILHLYQMMTQHIEKYYK